MKPTYPAPVLETMTYYQAKQSGPGVGVYSTDDWARLATALTLVRGASVLDIGSGNGAFLHILAKSKLYTRICGSDIRRHSRLDLPSAVEYELMSITKLSFADRSFDTVVCMEVLEHLELPDYRLAVREIRRVAKSRLVMTVPFQEPHPLWWHDRTGGHRQQFMAARILEEFPNARACMQKRKGTDWIFLVEGAEDDPSLVPVRQLLQGMA
jgi:ubiquinone/menaquinone biosynthesis C-methylase UbiE